MTTWHQDLDGTWTRNRPPNPRPRSYEQPLADADLYLTHRAHHESAHAVALLALGQPVTRLWITRQAGKGGGLDSPATYHDLTWNHLTALQAAGEVAASRLLTRTGLWTTTLAWAAERACAADRDTLQTQAPAYGVNDYSTHEGGWDWAFQQARELLHPHWALADALATRLLTAPNLELTGAQIQATADEFSTTPRTDERGARA